MQAINRTAFFSDVENFNRIIWLVMLVLVLLLFTVVIAAHNARIFDATCEHLRCREYFSSAASLMGTLTIDTIKYSMVPFNRKSKR